MLSSDGAIGTQTASDERKVGNRGAVDTVDRVAVDIHVAQRRAERAGKANSVGGLVADRSTRTCGYSCAGDNEATTVAGGVKHDCGVGAGGRRGDALELQITRADRGIGNVDRS